MLTTSNVNGFQVVSYNMPHVETVSLGIWANVGSRHEVAEHAGISHFVEHMVFKGTKTRSALDIAKSIEKVGGYMNAYTTREMTGYYAKVIKADMWLAFEIIADMLLNPAFDVNELEKERNVILQEIAQSYDNPSDIVFDYFQDACFKKQQLGSPVLGSADTVKSTSSKDLFDHISKYYSEKNNLVFSAAGNIDHKVFEDMVSKYFSSIHFNSEAKKNTSKAYYVGDYFEEKRGLEQAHIVLGFKGEKCGNDDYYNMLAYSNILGSGMSSKLFQQIREKNGLAYSIYSFPLFYEDCGVLGIYAGTTHEVREKIVDMIVGEMHEFTVSDEELLKAKNQLSAAVLMELESTSSMADSLASDVIRHGHVRTTEETLSKINAINKEGVISIAKRILDSKMSHVLLW